MALSPEELADELVVVGNRLLFPPEDVSEVISLLNMAEILLSHVEQAPCDPVEASLAPVMKVVISEQLMRHGDAGVKVSTVSCLTEITRITAPKPPYDDATMKELFELTVAALGNLRGSGSGDCYSKAITILDTVTRVRSYLMMLDLECHHLIVEMFKLFVNSSVRCAHVLPLMETVMTAILQATEGDESVMSMQLLSRLVACLTKRGQAGGGDGALVAKADDDEENGECYCRHRSHHESSNRKRKPNSLMHPEEGYDHSWVIVGSGSRHVPAEDKRTVAVPPPSSGGGGGEDLIGRRIKVWWPMDKIFYEGLVTDFDRLKRKHRVSYTDGDEEVLNLDRERWQLVKR